MAFRRTKDSIQLDGETLRGSTPRAAPVLTMKGNAGRLYTQSSLVAEQCFVDDAAKRSANQWGNPEQP
jgi:hypothetical protein